MFCCKCGNELGTDAQFCHFCGTAVQKEPAADDVIKSSKSVNRTGALTKIALIIMAVIIVAMGTYLVVDIIGDNGEQVNSDTGIADDKTVDLAISALTRGWQDLYKEGKAGNGRLEILHTRVVKIDPSVNGEFFSKLNKGDLIECIVEFVLYSDCFESAPYYHNANMYDTVIIYSDGTAEVSNNILRMYSNYTYSYDYSKLVKSIKDYGTAFNKTIHLNKSVSDSDTIPESSNNHDLKVATISAGFAIKNSSEEIVLDASHVDKISICQTNDGYSVKLTLTEIGKNIFSQYTANNINATSYICVYDTPIMAPVIPEPITDGVLTIPMNTYDDAESLFDTLS